MTLPVGVTVRDPAGSRYLIEGLLGEGGASAVYLVRDRRVKERLFALKEVIDPNKQARVRFTFEGELLQRLSHRALPQVYRVFEHQSLRRVYMLMDYIEGRNLEVLRQELPGKRFSMPVALALLEPIIDALIYLHQQDPPIVHRDVKPANIITSTRGDGTFLVDFGIAKEYVADATTTVFRHGSPGYAALEQYGDGTTPRTDIYGLGATLYTLLTGMIPPDAITRATANKRFDPLEPANVMVPEVSWAVAEALRRAMSISSEERFETVEAFWQEVTHWASQQQVPRVPLSAPSTPLPLPEQNWKQVTTAPVRTQRHAPRSRKGVALLPIVLVLLLIITMGVAFLPTLLRHDSPVVAPSRQQTTPSHPAPTVTSAAATPSPSTSLYPHLAFSYAGTVFDLLAKEKTPMLLTQIAQNQGSLRGSFQGLGLVGPFKGTVTPSGQVQFTLKVYGGEETLAFAGNIKIGGDIVGSFNVLDHNGEPTGESGLWNISTSP